MVPRPSARQLVAPESLNIGFDADDELGRIVLRIHALTASRRTGRQPRVLRFRVNLRPALALALLDDAPDLASGPIATTCQQLQRQIDHTAYQAEPTYAGPDAPARKTRAAPIFDLRFICSV
jgi:hypothetical protein